MAGSKYAYVKAFEQPDSLLPNTFLLCRVDGHAFHRFTSLHDFQKPNDERGLRLMDAAAKAVMEEFPDIVLAFGESDECSFLLRRSTSLYTRRESKILSSIVSLFTASYIFLWPTFFSSSSLPPLDPDNDHEQRPNPPKSDSTTTFTTLRYPPTFDARIVCYPTEKEVKDYFRWRQVDTHINNLYNTVFWALVQQEGQTTTEAHATLRGTVSSQKHEILFSRFGINYNTLPARYRKGSILVRETVPDTQDGQQNQQNSEAVFPPQSQSQSVGRYALTRSPTTTKTLNTQNPASEALQNEEDRPNATNRDSESILSADNSVEVEPALELVKGKEHGQDQEREQERNRLGDQERKKEFQGERETKKVKKGKAKAVAKGRGRGKARKTVIVVLHEDLINEEFWERRKGIIFEE